MAYPLPPLTWLRTFEAAARHLSFARASLELGLTPAAVSQQIRALEGHVGFALFDRLARGIRLTSMGSAYLPPVRRALDELVIATTGLFGAPARRVLTIRSAVSFATLCLAPHLERFLASHPGIRLRIHASVWTEEIESNLLDVDIRYGDGKWDGFDKWPLGPPISVPVCPPGTRLGRDLGSDLREAVRQRPIHIIGCENLWTQLARELDWPAATVEGGIAVDSSLIALQLAAAGSGSALIAAELAHAYRNMAPGCVLPDIELHHDQCHWLLMPQRIEAPSSDALLFRDWLVTLFSQTG